MQVFQISRSAIFSPSIRTERCREKRSEIAKNEPKSIAHGVHCGDFAKSTKLMKQAIQLGAYSAANMGLVILFQWYVFTEMGPGIATDALFAGMTIPQLVLGVISFSLMHVLVPLLAGEDDNRLRHDAWAFFFLVGGSFGLLAVALYTLAPWWVPLTVPGFSAAGQLLTVDLTRIQLVGMAFTAVNGVQWAVYHSRQKFLWAEFTPVLASALALMLLVWVLPRYGITAAAWLLALRAAALTLLLAPGMGRPVCPDLGSPAVRQAWHRTKPLLMGTAYYKTDPLIDRFLLSTAISGSLSLYYLAQQIYGAINQIFNKAIVAPLVPALSMLHKSGNEAGFRKVYRQKMFQAGSICVLGMLILIFLGQAALNLLVGHGKVDSANVVELWWIMVWLGGVFIGGGLGQITASSFYARGDTTTPVRISILTYTAYIPFKVAAFYLYGVIGLALVTSIYYVVNLSLQIFFLERVQSNDF